MAERSTLGRCVWGAGTNPKVDTVADEPQEMHGNASDETAMTQDAALQQQIPKVLRDIDARKQKQPKK